MKEELKLYIWADFNKGGLAFAIAEDEQEAKRMIINERGFKPESWGNIEVRDLNKVARSVSGGG